MIEVRDLNFSFGKKPILKNINLKIEAGEKVIIIGPNGCGKTTLLRLISGYLSPSSGEILLKNKNIKEYKIKERAKILAMINQSGKTPFNFTVLETVKMGRYPFMSWYGGFSNADKALVDKSIDLMNINHLKEHSILNISGGECARTMAARAFAQNPELMLMDEPVSALDINQTLHLMNLFKNDKERAFLIVLHDLNLASQYAEKIILMCDGEIVSQGSPEKVITAENISAVYKIDSKIIEVNNRPFIIPYV